MILGLIMIINYITEDLIKKDIKNTVLKRL
jgi:hypothetical protein